MPPQKRKAKFINPPNTLKKKVGDGGIPEQLLKNAQRVMNTYDSDFRPEARKLLEALIVGLKSAEIDLKAQKEPNKDHLIFPVMQLKANGGMFKFTLLSDVADICLQFLESIEHYNIDTLEVIKIHQTTINVIIDKNLKGSGGDEGYILVQELHKACLRYFKKYNQKEVL